MREILELLERDAHLSHDTIATMTGLPVEQVAEAVAVLADNGYPDVFIDLLYVSTSTDSHLEWVERLLKR